MGLIIEILTGPLVGASFCGVGERNNWGNLIFALDPSILVDMNNFEKETAELIAKFKAMKKMPGVKELYYPGERGFRKSQAVVEEGEIELEDSIYEAIVKKSGRV